MRQAMRLAALVVLTLPASSILAEEKSQAEKAAADWLYPGAKVNSSGHGGSVSCVVQETADDAPKVLKHYKDKLGVELSDRGSESGLSFSSDGKSIEYTQFGLKPEAAGGVMHVSTFKTKAACATLVVCRPRDSKTTTITITHVPLAGAK